MPLRVPAQAGTIPRMNQAHGGRIGWRDLPDTVRRGVQDILGGQVAEAVSQPGGFSPGTADRIRTADGRRAFVKAVSPAQNEHSPVLHRREGRITAALPPVPMVPRLLGVFDDGYWVALVLEDIAGCHPATPWAAGQIAVVARTLRALAAELTPCPVPDLPAAAESFANDFAGWRRICDDPPGTLDPWAAAHLELLCELADGGLAALAGDTVVHSDIRADNLLIQPDGTVAVVDWPWACRGPAWLDTLLLAANVRLHGGHDTDALLDAHTAADSAQLTAVIAGLAGYFTDAARLPPQPGLPTVRALQRDYARALLPWLRTRLAA